MFQDYISGFVDQFQKCNDLWLQEFDRNKAAFNTPLNKAIYEMNMEDFFRFFEGAANQPATLLKVQMNWWESQLKIWQNIALAENDEPVVKTEKTDKRFDDESWQKEMFFNFIKQSYLLYSKTMFEMIESIEGLDPKVKERLVFFTRQAINSMSPSNFVLTNPELLRLTLEKDGENLVNGLQQLRKDMETSADVLRISMTSDEAFQLGEHIAATPGDVIFKNEIFELIQFRPKTAQIFETPLLIVPPFINKYYILDLRENNSMINWLVEQGYCVFTISWLNPGKEHATIGFEDYVLDGVVKAVSVIENITGQEQVHAAGYCIGGTVLGCAVAYYAAKRMKPRIKSASYFTTLLDFSLPGEVGNYVNEPLINALEMQNEVKGYMDGRTLSVIFSLLRENSLYWNYYIENYLKGSCPNDFDILYWNGDSTNITAAAHSFLLRELYLNNKLMEPKGIKIGTVFMDLKKIMTPSYFISTLDDHIALWQGTYKGALKPRGDTTFVLGGSGHIAGIINPPSTNKYEYWVNDNLCDNADEWLDGAENHKGSWWPHWKNWLTGNTSSEMVEPYPQGSNTHKILAPAPGEYVKQRLPISENV
ncbi:class I poly(R)-hydroxyalkanoic acid synthase [Desulfosediminicola flagellatus]|uniref:class I poly(R)-hydroxyalkanoic acid synthase n=1 Tax=Desulfosediminicola flagellatus TaxID=2569541 RepID=UPI0010AC262F|nr:class I poly(R)-hydroxyalkanoic acid synthase [Desulfosediminicola flagellatus]